MQEKNGITEISGKMEQDLSSCIYRTTKEAELLMDQISLKAREKARGECEKAFVEYEQRVQLVLKDMRETIDSKSNIIVEKIRESLVRKSESVSAKMVEDLISGVSGKTADLANYTSRSEVKVKSAEPDEPSTFESKENKQETESPLKEREISIKNNVEAEVLDTPTEKNSENPNGRKGEKISDIVNFFS